MKADQNGERRLRAGDNHNKIAQEKVKKLWVEQGIWNPRWNQFAAGKWKHEEPLELESESETDSETKSSRPLFPLHRPRPRRPKSDKESRRTQERRIVREREREASRPYYQFVYQISKERERIQDELRAGEGAGMSIVDINTTAYENIKNTWTKRGIWNKRWGILPGMSWKHEEPLEGDTAGGLAPRPNPVRNGSHEMGAPLRDIFGLVTISHHLGSTVVNDSRRGPSPGFASS